MFERNYEDKCFPAYVQRNTGHDGCLESQVSMANWFGKHYIFSALLESNHDISILKTGRSCGKETFNFILPDSQMYWPLNNSLLSTGAQSEKPQTETFMMLQMNYRKFCFLFESVPCK